MISGLLLVDKPPGPTSHDVVEAIRRAFGGIRCGHAGTLDPFAGGLLVVALGRATRLLRFLSGADKTYEGVVRLGFATDTDDATGRPLGEPARPDYTAEDLSRALAGLEGELDQAAPAYSARKHEGVPLYRLARRGIAVPAKSATVRVHWETCEPAGTGLLRIRISVSAGTYIRALARDLGAALGCGGHLAELRRVRSGPFRASDAAAFPAPREVLERSIIPVSSIPLDLPAMTMMPEQAALLRKGSRVPLGAAGTPGPSGPRSAPSVATGGWIRLLDAGGDLIAVAELLEGEGGPALQPRVVLAD